MDSTARGWMTPVDLWCTSSSMALRIVDRELSCYQKILLSLERIRSGDCVYCLETGDSVGSSALLAKPAAEYCVDVKASKEV